MSEWRGGVTNTVTVFTHIFWLWISFTDFPSSFVGMLKYLHFKLFLKKTVFKNIVHKPTIFPLANNQFLWNTWNDILHKVTVTAFALNVCSFWLLPSHFLDEALPGVCPCTDINQCAKRKSDGKKCINICMTAVINTFRLRSGQNKWKTRFFSHICVCARTHTHTYLYTPFHLTTLVTWLI